MRLDKFLKVSRVIKRRPVAKTVIDNKKAKINGKIAKAGTEIKSGDILELEYFNRYFKIEIVDVPAGNVPKDKAQDLVKIIEVKELEIPEKEELF
ncbi:RNA-binding S4 domain-containing protein [Ilyobacter polytropus]|uniref:RQC P-site tRNA stabilizing factor n=1 Tax=Ilyobacter polytropus (strain ATCC 51220 / DSM 2926 / LMG 16218 / CuHBu1) TaxID=572544 RepID=E3HAE0_ILYPC|nr:RNA-binding S4 domain-containing protein [Ilyobacter polytropus]ADO83670.1 RNA-binding S4 domain protein [Ilyobacter polytropus DSM 2926]